jgi:hypothetical protein
VLSTLEHQQPHHAGSNPGLDHESPCKSSGDQAT